MLHDLVAGRQAADLTEDSLQAPLGMPIDDQPQPQSPPEGIGMGQTQSRTSTGQSRQSWASAGQSRTLTGQSRTSTGPSRTSTGEESDAMLVSFTVAFGGVSEISADSCISSSDSISSTQLLEAAEAAAAAAAVEAGTLETEVVASSARSADLEEGGGLEQGDSSLLDSTTPSSAMSPHGGPSSMDSMVASAARLNGSLNGSSRGAPGNEEAAAAESPPILPPRQPSWREQMERAQRMRAQRQAAIDAWEWEQRQLQRERCEVQ